MKQLLTILTVFFCVAAIGCGKREVSKYKFVILVESGKTWTDKHMTAIYCDSFNMVSQKEAVLYIDGMKTTIHSDNTISAKSNTGY